MGEEVDTDDQRLYACIKQAKEQLNSGMFEVVVAIPETPPVLFHKMKELIDEI